MDGNVADAGGECVWPVPQFSLPKTAASQLTRQANVIAERNE